MGGWRRIEGLMIVRELLWAVYSAVHVLESSGRADYQALAKGWQAWLDYAKSTASKVEWRHSIFPFPSNYQYKTALTAHRSSIKATASSAP
jgi:hypothetical protein